MILALSDIHLGSPICQASLTLHLLENETYDTLIICGDLLDSYNIHRLCKRQWKVLSTLRKISKKKKCIFILKMKICQFNIVYIKSKLFKIILRISNDRIKLNFSNFIFTILYSQYHI